MALWRPAESVILQEEFSPLLYLPVEVNTVIFESVFAEIPAAKTTALLAAFRPVGALYRQVLRADYNVRMVRMAANKKRAMNSWVL
jgi:hypothetical protein